eukprot:TRINITY_DN2069_c0_g1_i1.p1 TRINITY_DN2069_c0_g1~~TRINITY_DN2069_c0_g1_i1.p1  ORF type:complete len:509 (-),score=101.10 TRINITY_DN2069_c0_g1_i1:1135-2619(-)
MSKYPPESSSQSNNPNAAYTPPTNPYARSNYPVMRFPSDPNQIYPQSNGNFQSLPPYSANYPSTIHVPGSGQYPNYRPSPYYYQLGMLPMSSDNGTNPFSSNTLAPGTPSLSASGANHFSKMMPVSPTAPMVPGRNLQPGYLPNNVSTSPISCTYNGKQLEKQEKVISYYQTKKEIEEKDALLAKLLSQSDMESITRKMENVAIENTDDDYLLALRLQEEEELEHKREQQERQRRADEALAARLQKEQEDREREEADARLARSILEEEKRMERERTERERREREKAEQLRRDEEYARRLDNTYSSYQPNYGYNNYDQQYWTNHDGLILVDKFSPEYSQILQVLSSGGFHSNRVKYIERNQNYSLFANYQEKKRIMGNPSERNLFYTGPRRINIVQDITYHGFSQQCKNTGGHLGAGIYLSTKVPCTRGRNNRIILCKSLIGNYGTGSRGINIPPFAYDNRRNQRRYRYDSVGNGTEFCVFDYDQLYPAYIIHVY